MVSSINKQNNPNSVSVKRYFKFEKMVCVDLVFDKTTDTIQSIKITGDFFLHPEETIDLIESGIVGTKLEKDLIKKKLESLLSDCELYGFSIDSLSDAIIKCKEADSH
ncbi:MAG: lipoate protein ligase C-terminal domain-containing protein [Nitrosopumilaceae archaeon]